MSIQQFNYSVDLLRVILWQYNEAENLPALIQRKQEWYNENQQQFWENWVRDVFDLRTANDFGLSVWSIILGLPLFTEQTASPSNFPSFGFGSVNRNFNRGSFATAAGRYTLLTTQEKRQILQLRYFTLASDMTVPSINAFMNFVFGDGRVFVTDNYDMTMTYTFNFSPNPRFLSAILDLDVLPRPSAVSLSIADASTVAWGFAPFRPNFNRSNFAGI